ncbi:MAG: hypothetical protein ACPHVR_07255 [Poseidonia sp.]
MVEGTPVVWVKRKPNAYRMVADQDSTRLEPSKSMGLRVAGTVFFLVMASITALFSLGIYNEAQSVDEPSASGCWNWQTEIIVGGNPPYCFDGTIRGVIESIEVSEDQHIRERSEDWETGYTYTEEYRWEDVGDSVVYGYIEGGRYLCVRYVPEFALPEDWVPADIDDAFEYPDWCGSSAEGQEDRVYEEGAHPYDDVWMYEADDVGAMSSFLYVHKTSETGHMERQYITKSYIEQDRAEWEAEGEIGLGPLFCTVPITLLFLFAADQRPRVFVINQQAKTITRRRRGRYPSFSRTWSDVNFSATSVIRSVRQKHHSTAETEHSPAEHWTTDHPGLNIVISYGPFREVLLFFEDGGDVNVHGQTISDFMAAIGLEFQAEQYNGRDEYAALYARPTLDYLAEYNGGVRQWDDQSANYIIGWYYESDPDFIKKYPQAEHDPEFMLEPHGNRPFKEMYRRPLYEGAGLTTVRSTEDAQRLLDHVLALRYPESTRKEAGKALDVNAGSDEKVEVAPVNAATQAPVGVDQGGVWGYGVTQHEQSADTGDADEQDPADAPTGSFWTFDDAQNP